MNYHLTTDYKNGVYCVESGYAGGGIASIYILRDSGRAAIIDTAHSGAIEPVRKAVASLGLVPSDVDYIFLTHVHLDHAGGAGVFAGAFPEAAVVVHERGARHIISPGRLVKSAAEVYGQSAMKLLYGEVLPVPANRIISPVDGGEFRVGTRTIVCLDTPGHARHHLAFHDSVSNSMFTGDGYGMSFMELSSPEWRGVIITTSPVQFDPDAMRSSMKRIEDASPAHFCLSHFGELPMSEALSSSLHRQLDLHLEIAIGTRGDAVKIKEGLREIMTGEFERLGCPVGECLMGEMTKRAIELNSQGLALWYSKTYEKEKTEITV